MAKTKPTLEEVLRLAQDVKEWKFHNLSRTKNEEILQGLNGSAIITIGYDYSILVDDCKKGIWVNYGEDSRIKELYEKIKKKY
ncbi:hypothetical protein J4211_01140 [Candidatus Woesearchaeota archaeon]|nr:hypothetical protein [Candidatus Woesearchaeota archaeon]